jgi:hypothetical protein
MKHALGFMLAFSICAASPSPAPTPPRDLSSYTTLGPYLMPDSPNALTPEDRALITSQIRKFVVDCWQQHRRGRLITVTFTMEGLPVRHTYFVEPDSGGTWRIVVDTVAAVPGIKPSGEHYTVDHTTIATLESRNTPDGQKHFRIVSDGKTLLDL